MIIADYDAVGFTYQGENLCRYCTWDALSDIVTENGYATPEEAEGLGIFNLMRICDAFGTDFPGTMTTSTESYVTDVYDSGDFPKPFEECDDDERCMNLECQNNILSTYRRTVGRI